MRALSVNEVEAVSGGDGVAAGAATIGAATATGAALAAGSIATGGLALVVYAVAFTATTYLMK